MDADLGIVMRYDAFLLGIGFLVAFTSVLAYYAQVHRPFSESPAPFVYAFAGVAAVLVALIFIVRYFVKL